MMVMKMVIKLIMMVVMKEILPGSSECLVKLLGGLSEKEKKILFSGLCLVLLFAGHEKQIYEGFNGPQQCMNAAMLLEQRCNKKKNQQFS